MRPPYSLISRFLPIVACALALVPSGAAAAPSPPMVVAVHPASGGISSFFDVRVQPGRQTLAGTLEIRNRVNRPITVLLDRVDGLTASTLGSAYRVRGTSIKGPTRWVSLSKRRVKLPAHGRTSVRVTVTPPDRARPGDYLSGIGVQARGERDESSSGGNLAISSVQRYAVGVQARVSGPRHPMIRLTHARVEREPAGVTFYIHGRNPGNVILKDVRGRQLITKGNRTVAEGAMGPGTFVTGTSIAYPVLVPDEQPREGTIYRVRAHLRYRGGIARLDTLVRFGRAAAVKQAQLGGPEVPESDSNGLPLAAILAAAIGAAAIFFLLFLWLRRRSRRRSPLQTLEHALEEARERGELDPETEAAAAQLLEQLSEDQHGKEPVSGSVPPPS
jgi:hypothetical protein